MRHVSHGGGGEMRWCSRKLWASTAIPLQHPLYHWANQHFQSAGISWAPVLCHLHARCLLVPSCWSSTTLKGSPGHPMYMRGNEVQGQSSSPLDHRGWDCNSNSVYFTVLHSQPQCRGLINNTSLMGIQACRWWPWLGWGSFPTSSPTESALGFVVTQSHLLGRTWGVGSLLTSLAYLLRGRAFLAQALWVHDLAPFLWPQWNHQLCWGAMQARSLRGSRVGPGLRFQRLQMKGWAPTWDQVILSTWKGMRSRGKVPCLWTTGDENATPTLCISQSDIPSHNATRPHQ